MEAKNSLKNATVEATVVRADGTRVPLGVICKMKQESVIKRIIKKIFRR